MGGKVDEPCMRDVGAGRIEIRIELHAHIRPVIEPRSFEQFIRYAETERLDQVERRMGGRAGSRYIPGILGYFRLVEENSEHEL